jgi:hypothetical protein
MPRRIDELVDGSMVVPLPDTKLGVVQRNDGVWHVLVMIGEDSYAMPVEAAREIGAALGQIANDLDAKRVGGFN